MRYLISSTVLFLILATPVLAQGISANELPEWLTKLYDKTDQKVISPVKQIVDSMKQKSLEQKNQEILKKAQETIEKKQEELLDKAIDKGKQESKKIVKNWIQGKIAWIEELLNPLKIKIQEGSDIIRGWIEDIRKDFK